MILIFHPEKSSCTTNNVFRVPLFKKHNFFISILIEYNIPHVIRTIFFVPAYQKLSESVSFCVRKVDFPALVRLSFKLVLIFHTLKILTHARKTRLTFGVRRTKQYVSYQVRKSVFIRKSELNVKIRSTRDTNDIFCTLYTESLPSRCRFACEKFIFLH